MRLSEFVSFMLILTLFMVVTFAGIKIVESYHTLCTEVHAIAESVERIENPGPPAGSADVFNQER